MRAQQLIQQAAQHYPDLKGWDNHHLIPRFIADAWRIAGMRVPQYIAEAQVRLPNAYHQLVHNRINDALRGIDIKNPANFQKVLNAIEKAYWEAPML